MRFLIITLGSAGDLHPFLAIARALAERGADVRLASQEPHRAEVEAQGVRFESIVSAHDHHRTAAHPDLWHPVNGFGVLWRHLAVPAIGPTIELIARLDAESPRGLTVLASPLVVGARLAAEVRQIRHVTGITAPSALRSNEDPMLLGPWQVPSWLPSTPRRWLWKALDRWKLEPMAANAVQHWREQLGLAPLCEPIFDQWIHSSREIMGLYPKAFAHPPREWASKLELHGFPLYETQVASDVDPELRQYLAQAERLVVFYPGSVPTAAGELMSESAQQIAKSGVSVLLIGPESAESEATIGQPKPLVRARVSLPQVLDHAQLLVHHGGIGISAQAHARQVPQWCFPTAYDQFDNAQRWAQLQPENRVLDFQRLKPTDLTRLISEAMRVTAHQPGMGVIPAREPSGRSREEQDLAYSRPGRPNAAVRSVVARLMES